MDKLLSTSRGGSDLLGFLHSLVLIGLALLGMGGLIYHVIGPRGVIASWLADVWSSHPALTSIVIVGLLTMSLAAGTSANTRPRTYKDTSLHFFVVVGMFFAGRIFVLGKL